MPDTEDYNGGPYSRSTITERRVFKAEDNIAKLQTSDALQTQRLVDHSRNLESVNNKLDEMRKDFNTSMLRLVVGVLVVALGVIGNIIVQVYINHAVH